jgi:hypothetical protein
MGQNLTGQLISATYEDLVQISGSLRNILTDGTGSDITSLAITASNAISSSYALTASYATNVPVTASYAISASHADLADLALVANTATSASYAATATSASHALNANSALTATSASYASTSTSASHALVADSAGASSTAISASHAVNADSAISASYATNTLSASFATTASYALNAGVTVDTGSLMVTGSATNNVLTFTKGDGSTFNLTVATGSGGGGTTPTGSLLVTASISNATTTFTKGDGSTFSITANNVVNANSASVATSASYALTASYAANASTPSLQQVTDVGATTNDVITVTGPDSTLKLDPNINSGYFAKSPNSGDTGVIFGLYLKNLAEDKQGGLAFIPSSGDVYVFADNDLYLDSIKWPTADGTNGQAIITNGAGALSFSSTVPSASFATSASYAPSPPLTLQQVTDNGASSNNALELSGTTNKAGVLNSIVSSTGITISSSVYPTIQIIENSPLISPAQIIFSSGSGLTQYGSIGSGANKGGGLEIIPRSGPLTISGNEIVSGSLIVTSGITGSLQGTASFAISASYAPSLPAFPFTGSAQITGSLGVTGSIILNDPSQTFLRGNNDFNIGNATATQAIRIVGGDTIFANGNNRFDSNNFEVNSSNIKLGDSSSDNIIISGSIRTNLSSSITANAVYYNSSTGLITFGPTGSSGGGGTSATGSFTGTTWTFTHNLNQQPVVIQTFDANWEEIIPQTVDLTDANTATISFPVSVAGYAVASLGNGITQGSATALNSPINVISNNLGAMTSPSLYTQKVTISTPGVYNVHISQSGPYWVDLTGVASGTSASVNIYMWADQLNTFGAYTGSSVMFSANSGSGNYVAYRTIVTGSSTTEYWGSGTTIGNSSTTISRQGSQEQRNIGGVSGNPTSVVKYPDGTLMFMAPAGNVAFPSAMYKFTGSNGTPIA